jgi:S1-C subfamily serine protease
MKNPILLLPIVMFAIFIGLIVSAWGYVTSVDSTTNKYCNMVNSSVLVSYSEGWASGVFIDDDVIAVAAHILEGRKDFTIELVNGVLIKTNCFYIDNREDVGFIFVDANELCIANFSNAPRNLGDVVYLVGAPRHVDFKFTLFKGIISHLNRTFSEMNWTDLFQIDADGSGGCSGGPIYNDGGYLIGLYVGQSGRGGNSIGLCESAESILEAYERYKNASDQ